MTSQVHAAPGDKEKAAAHYRQGKTFLNTKQYDQAIAEFQAAYAIDKLGSHLFNIADAYDAKQDYARAIEYYQKYLEAEPQTQRREEVRGRIATATKALADAEAKRKADEQAAALEAKRVAGLVHVKQAAAYEQAGAWGEAGDEHRLAFTVDGDPAHLLAAAEAYRKHPSLVKARDAYAAYLDKVPLGETSDRIRSKLADLTREIDKAEIDKAKQVDPVLDPKAPKPPLTASVQVTALAINAQAAALRGDCSVARAVAKQIHDQDAAYYDAVVVPGIEACLRPPRPRRYGFSVELRFGAFKSADDVEGGMLVAHATLGSFPPAPTTTWGLGGFVDRALSAKLRLRVGLRFQTSTAQFDTASCPATATCPAKLRFKFGGPALTIEHALYRTAAMDFHYLIGGAAALAAGRASLDVVNGAQTTDGPDVDQQTHVDLELGVGVRYRTVFVNLVGQLMVPSMAQTFDTGSGKALSINIGFTTLR